MGSCDFDFAVHIPVAVFLGPSLSRDRASQRLAANYYPPARMGDIYRLAASGVRLIVLIDGIFHAAAAVWQREILEVLAHGIQVLGAASMGALRAAELHRFGMIGIGTVFEWYRDQRIDSDDEVALLHGDDDSGYRPLSEPLVNIRYKLDVAVQRQLLAADQAGELLALAKRASFAQRSYQALLDSTIAMGWPPATREAVQALFADRALDLKTRDAERALEQAQIMLAHAALPPGQPVPAPSRFYLAASKRNRGFLHPRGYLVSGERIWDEISHNQALLRPWVSRSARCYYLRLLAAHWQLDCPVAYMAAFAQRWQDQHGIRVGAAWLRANGLTAAEYQTLLRQRAIIAWMVEQGPGHFGLSTSFCPRLPTLWTALDRRPTGAEHPSSRDDAKVLRADDDDLATRALELGFIAAWADIRGITCPAEYTASFADQVASTLHESAIDITSDQWRPVIAELARCQWLLGMQPYHVGYTGWSPIVAVLEELQLTGRAARIVAERL